MSFRIAIIVGLALLMQSCKRGNLSKDEIPISVQNSFRNNYPSITDTDWEREGDLYEAEYEIKGMEMTVLFDSNGNIISTENEIDPSGLPSIIPIYVEGNYSKYKIEEAAKMDKEGSTFFKVEIKDGKQEVELIFDINGNFAGVDEDDADEDELEEDDD